MLEKIEAKLEELEAMARYVPEPIKELLRLIGLEHDIAISVLPQPPKAVVTPVLGEVGQAPAAASPLAP